MPPRRSNNARRGRGRGRRHHATTRNDVTATSPSHNTDAADEDDEYDIDYIPMDAGSSSSSPSSSGASGDAAKLTSEQASGVRQLKQYFGRFLSDDVLLAVLAMCNNSFEEAKAFFESGGAAGDGPNDSDGPNSQAPAPQTYDYTNYNPETASASGVPQDYFVKPEIAQAPVAVASSGAGVSETFAHILRILTSAAPLTSASGVTYSLHLEAQTKHRGLYVALLASLVQNGYELTAAAKARSLAAAWARHDHAFADALLSSTPALLSVDGSGLQALPKNFCGRGQYSLPDVLRAVTILDTPRKIRVLEKKLAKLQESPAVRKATLNKIKLQLAELKVEPVPQGSLSGALSKRVRAWIAQIGAADLSFFGLHLPPKPWKELADLVHPHPTKSFAIDWFLPVAFGESTSRFPGCVVDVVTTITQENISAVLRQHQIPYSFIRKLVADKKRGLTLSDADKTHIAQYTSLDQVIWYFEELACEGVEQVVISRIDAGETVQKMPYGKLMDRLLFLKLSGSSVYSKLIPLAETMMNQVSLPLPGPVVCLGDASFSMDVAIRVSTIICSLVSKLTSADLLFFSDRVITPPLVPKSVTDVIELASTVKAQGLTASACSLTRFYNERVPVKLFMVTSDEIENIKYKDPQTGSEYYFPQLFYKYHQEVYPAEIVMVSFGEQNVKGRMTAALEQFGLKPILFALEGRRPDLSKLDNLLGTLAVRTREFAAAVEAIAAQLSPEPFVGNREWEMVE